MRAWPRVDYSDRLYMRDLARYGVPAYRDVSEHATEHKHSP
jgi:hypothetical protein